MESSLTLKYINRLVIGLNITKDKPFVFYQECHKFKIFS